MDKEFSWEKFLLHTLSHLLIAVLASVLTMAICMGEQQNGSKLEELKALLLEQFINEADETAIEDAAAEAMVAALGDRWSYYIPASEYDAYMEQTNNVYVGIGVTLSLRKDGTGFDVREVSEDGSAKKAGILPGDIIVEVEGQNAAQLGFSGVRELIQGEAGTTFTVTILRDGVQMPMVLTRKILPREVVSGQLLENKIGLVRIRNFDERCAQEAKTVISQLMAQGAEALILDVRNNPGGYKRELVNLLDHLLPEGTLFRSLDNRGRETVSTSDAACLELPMAVLINGNTYSAAEFFAAALEEYDWAVTVGEATGGKSYYQNIFQLSDGSAVGVSTGKYFTPKGVSLADTGGLVPELQVPVDSTTALAIYAGRLQPKADPQIQAAIEALLPELQKES